MTGYARTLLAGAAVLVCTGMLLTAGCSEDDPVSPGTQPEKGYLAVSPDSLMALWQTALTTRDSTMYGDLFTPEFRFPFSAGDLSVFQPPNDHLDRAETVRTAWNMFGGQSVTNWQGAIVPGVSRISFPIMVQETPWEIVTVGSAPPSASARFTLQMFVERGYGTPTLGATGTFDFLATSADTTDAAGLPALCYRWFSMVPATPLAKTTEVNTWGGVHLTYLTNEAPTADLQVSDVGGTPLPLYRCDASGSTDPDGGLHAEPFRWRFDTDAGWTGWSADPVTTRHYPSPGTRTITVEVRDRWDARATASRTVEVPAPDLPFPDTPDQLMANFQAAYGSRYLDGFLPLLDPDFLVVLQPSTVQEFPGLGQTLDFAEVSRIHRRMFSGEAVTDPDGQLVPGVSEIFFGVLQALDDWVASPPDDIFPNTRWAPFDVRLDFFRGQQFSTLRTWGVVKFYVTSRDSLHQGTNQPYYQLAGMVDLTGNKAIEESSWGSIQALFR